MANLRLREGILGGRSGVGNSGEVHLRIDPMHADLDDEITGLHQKIRQLKGVALEIEGEAKFQNDFLAKLVFKPKYVYFIPHRLMSMYTTDILSSIFCLGFLFFSPKDRVDLSIQMTVIKAQAGLKNNMRRMNSSIIRQGSNHVLHVVLFALFCFFLVYLWTKYSRR